MIYTIATFLFVIWLLALIGSQTVGGFIHVILVIAIILVIVGVIQGRSLL